MSTKPWKHFVLLLAMLYANQKSIFCYRFGSKMTGADVSSWKRDNKSSGTSGRRPVSAFEPSTQVQINISVPAGLRTASPKISRSSGLLHDPSKKGVALPSNTKGLFIFVF